MAAASGHEVLEFHEWRGGEFGQKGQWQAAKNEFTANNMIMLLDGSMAPRREVQQYTLTGIPAGSAEVTRIGVMNSALLAENRTWAVHNGDVFGWDPSVLTSQAVKVYTGSTTSGVPASHVDLYNSIGQGVSYYFADNAGFFYQINHDLQTVKSVGGLTSGVGSVGVLYSGRLVCNSRPDFAVNNPPNRLYYSEAPSIPAVFPTYADGVTSSGTPSFDSATANFGAADVGYSIIQTGGSAAIPAGTTILSRQSGSHVTLSQNATASVSGITFTIGRPSVENFKNPITGTTNFIDVGSTDSQITALVPIYRGLLIAKGSVGGLGSPYQWWLLTGDPGNNDSLRELSIGFAADDGASAAVLGDNKIMFASYLGGLATFDGAVGHPLFNYPTKLVNARCNILPLKYPGDVLVLNEQTGSQPSSWLRRRGVWTQIQFNPTVTNPKHVGVYNVAAAGGVINDMVIFASWTGSGGSSGSPTFWRWSPYIEDFSAPRLPGSMTSFQLPEQWSRPDDEWSVRTVIVDFQQYSGGGTATFTLNVTPIRRYEGTDGATQTFAYSQASPPAQVNRRSFGFAPDYGAGIRISFSNIAGVSIQKVFVVIDKRPRRASGVG